MIGILRRAFAATPFVVFSLVLVASVDRGGSAFGEVPLSSSAAPVAQAPTKMPAPAGVPTVADPAAQAERFIRLGETLWRSPRGPRNVSLEGCDFGEGPGHLDGAFAKLPRYFADAGEVMDVEQRLLWCMTTLQGLDVSDIRKQPFRGPGQSSDMEMLAVFVASRSNGYRLESQSSHPGERTAIDAGRAIFFRRSATMDFACATCHAGEPKRVLAFSVPRLDDHGATAQHVMGSWPVFGVRQQAVRTLQFRLRDCYREMRMPPPAYASAALTDLMMYLVSNADGGIVQVPSIKR